MEEVVRLLPSTTQGVSNGKTAQSGEGRAARVACDGRTAPVVYNGRATPVVRNGRATLGLWNRRLAPELCDGRAAHKVRDGLLRRLWLSLGCLRQRTTSLKALYRWVLLEGHP
ncbi:unnamed protein product [Ilex paraguariensis]|uniref:Uncharacterized protein n=2 Tax=Ilex paraguariensis TaxID=185542 RepID=A0ABC8UKD6_9AQUA